LQDCYHEVSLIPIMGRSHDPLNYLFGKNGAEMSLPKLLAKRVMGLQRILMAHHQAGAMLANASKGMERETLIREFLEKVFPLPYRFGSGTMVDSTNASSGQLDIVVEFPFWPSFPNPGGSQRLYLADSVAFVVEAKSDLSSQWDQVEQSVAKARPLRRFWRGHVTLSGPAFAIEDESQSRVPFVAVGFCGHSTIESLEKRMNETPEERRPDAALVIESGAYKNSITGRRGLSADGLFEFCLDLAYFARNVLTADIAVEKYQQP
jgi:hypothetical protein